MNIERLTKIAEWCEAQVRKEVTHELLSMETFRSPVAHCGTAYCIAGYAVDCFYETVTGIKYSWQLNEGTSTVATQLLELPADVAHELFFAEHSEERLSRIDAAWAARCIRKLIATGVVDWPGTRGEDPQRLVFQDGGVFYDNATGEVVANYGDTCDWYVAYWYRTLFMHQHAECAILEGDE